MKIFGREPAAWSGLLQAVLGALLAFGLFGLDHEEVALSSAAFSALLGVYVAYSTKLLNVATVVSAAQVVVAMLVGFGLDLPADTTAALIGVLQMALALFLRQNTEPATDPGFHSEPLTGTPVEVRSVAEPTLPGPLATDPGAGA